MSSSEVEWRIDAEDHVGQVQLRRPPNNFLDLQTLRELASAMAALDKDSRCRTILLAAEGKHFCAGRDFSATRSEEDSSLNVYREACRLMELEKPWIALVNGGAIGAGLGLAMAADFRLCTERAYFSGNFVKLGLHHGFGLSVTLPHVIGNTAASDMLYTGRRVGSAEALALGLVSRVVDEAGALDQAIAFAREISAHPTAAVREIRKTLRGDLAERFRKAVEHEAKMQALVRGESEP